LSYILLSFVACEPEELQLDPCGLGSMKTQNLWTDPVNSMASDPKDI